MIDESCELAYCLLTKPKIAMDFLLAFNNDAALIGDLSGKVRTERRPSQLTAQAWENRLQFAYIEAERGGEDTGMRYTNATGSFRFENGQVKVMRVDGVKPFEVFSDDTSGLSVRAAFIDHLNQWTVAE